MFKKENIQYYIGAAAGVTVGLCVGKLLSSNTSIVIQNKIYPNTSDKSAPVRRSIGKILKPDDMSTNKYHSRSKSAPRYNKKNIEDSTFLMAPLAKPALSDSNINIDTKTPVKQVKLYKTLPTSESCQILDEEKSLSQNTETCSLNNVKEKIRNSTIHVYETTTPNANSALKSDLMNIKKIEDDPGTIIKNPSDSSNENISLYVDSNIAACNTIVDMKQANLTSILNDNEFLDSNHYDDFNEYNLISSTKCDISIPF
ncbi:uncharacterized protein LOC126852555 [Cataglyphis hispanica]|uniref:uncharacterized protein LOC126852555 n=1 Tax=Cataglyphis hispanica TaxID=1086592 RepID=UPI00217F6CCA|nr:uncharacterized protein LOC126852555 [Cataglyphis hispanica]